MTYKQLHLVDPGDLAGLSIDERFARFHAANPHVYERLKEMARLAKSRGRSRFAIATLFEVLRWERVLSTDTDESLKLNNNYRALYARLLMAQEPDLEGFFETRQRPRKRPQSSQQGSRAATEQAVIAKWAKVMGEEVAVLRQVIQLYFKPGWEQRLPTLPFSSPKRREQTMQFFRELAKLKAKQDAG